MGIDGAGTARAQCVLAPNPSPMTLDGTNTFVLAEPGATEAVVVDPGPADDGHLQRAAEQATRDGRRVAVVLLTHGHLDHSEGAARFAELVGAPLRAADPQLCAGGEPLADGERIDVAGLVIDVLATPGHTTDSVSYHLPADAAVLTGDTVLGRGTTVVTHPDGDLGAYLGSLHRLRELVTAQAVTTLLPAHGPMLADPAAVLDGYLAHRAERLDQVRAAVAAGHRTAMDVVRSVYAEVDQRVWPAAEQSVNAQLDYLRARGEL
ncbi:MAG: MBL fold metallo-hydrolase [Streptosporangiales bacterium]|nr:MBL fold metallo-hydrolase [Streptosporangiales bacterium]